MKNIVFDLGGVLFARDKSKCTPELIEFFSFLRAPRMPFFWEEYDRGTSTLDEVTVTVSEMTGRSVEACSAILQLGPAGTRETHRTAHRRPESGGV